MAFINNETFAKICEFFQKGERCDLVLISAKDQTRVAAHRLVVSAASEVFDTMLTTPMKERESKEIPIGDISGTVLKNLIEFCYTGQFHIDADNINEVLAAAHMFRFGSLVASCAEYLNRFLSVESCFDTLATAKLYDLQDVTSALFKYISEHFSVVLETDGFRRLNVEHLIEILGNHELAVKSEEDIFHAIIKWIDFDVENRRGQFEKLVSTVRMSQITYAFLIEHVLTFLNKAGIQEQFVGVCESARKSQQQSVSKIRRVYKTKGIYAFSQNIIQRFDQPLNSWEIVYTLSESLSEFGAICINNQMFLFGGMEKGATTNKIRCISLNAVKPELKEIKPMKYRRAYFAAAELSGFVYATGGCFFSIKSSSVERMDLRTMEWTELPHMQQERSCHSIAALSGKLFVTGGCNDNRLLDHVEYYDPQLTTWTTVASMNIPRMDHRCVVVDDILYAIGGSSGSRLSSIEKFDEKANKWTLMEIELQSPRRHFGAIVLNKWIFIGGGKTNGKETNTVEKINIETGERVVLPSLNSDGESILFVADP